MKSFFRPLFLQPRAKLYAAINVAPVAPASHVSAINVAFDPKVEWSTLKYGVYPNAVGLQVFDREAAEAIVKTFNSRLDRLADAFRGLPGYVGHPDDPAWAKQNPQVRAEAVARIREMRVGEKGLEFRTAFNDEGKRLVLGDAPAFEAYSPNWGMVETTYKGRKAFRPVELYSIGFTNQPNIPGTLIGLNEALPPETKNSDPMNKKLIELLALLGITLGADATDAQATTAINEALPKVQSALADQGKLATAVNEVSTVKAQLTAAQGQVTTAVNEASNVRTSLATERAARAGLVITTAINEGRLTEAGRAEWLGKFTAQGASFDTVAADLGKLTKAVNTKSKTDIGARRGQPVSPEAKQRINAINEAIQAKMTTAKCDRTTAYIALQSEKPELFPNDKS